MTPATPEGAALKLGIDLLAAACVEGATVVDTLGSPVVGARIQREDGTTVPVLPNSAEAWRTTPSPMLDAVTDELCAAGPLPVAPTIHHRDDGLHVYQSDGEHWHSVDQAKTWRLREEPPPAAPPPSDRGHGWYNDGGVSPWGFERAEEPLPVVSTWPAVVSTDLVVLGPDAARKLGAVLNELDTYAAGGPADLTRNLRALLGLPRTA